eukprot:UN05349
MDDDSSDFEEDPLDAANDLRALEGLDQHKEELEEDKRAMARDMGKLTDAQLKRFESLSRATINHKLVKHLMAETLDIPPKTLDKTNK